MERWRLGDEGDGGGEVEEMGGREMGGRETGDGDWEMGEMEAGK